MSYFIIVQKLKNNTIIAIKTLIKIQNLPSMKSRKSIKMIL